MTDWSGDILARVAQRYARPHGRLAAIEAELFDRQLEFYRDPSPLRSVRCTRRAGKTEGAAARDHLADLEKFPGDLSVYCCPTLPQALGNVQAVLDGVARRLGLPVRHTQEEGQHYWAHENGARLWVTGCDNLRQAQKFRGKKYRKFKIDEGGAWPSELLEYVVRESVGPALSDYGGTLDILGTPGPLPVGYWHDVDTGLGAEVRWSSHTWSVLDNPYHRYYQAEELISAEVVEPLFGGDATNPQFLREWRGMWAADENALIYRPSRERNYFDDDGNIAGLPSMPTDPAIRWHYVLGVDFGWHDKFTLTVTASRPGFREVWFLESHGASGQEIGDMERGIRRVLARYPINRIVCDTAGGGKVLTESLSSALDIPLEAAPKREKAIWARALGSAILSGTAMFHSRNCRELLSEYSVLAWNEDRDDHSPLCVDDCADSALYSWRCHPQFERWEQEPPKPGTPEALQQWAEQHKLSLTTKRGTGRRRVSGRFR